MSTFLTEIAQNEDDNQQGEPFKSTVTGTSKYTRRASPSSDTCKSLLFGSREKVSRGLILPRKKIHLDDLTQADLGKADLHEMIRGNVKKTNSIVPLGLSLANNCKSYRIFN